MRQYAGFGTAEATNERFKFLLEAGQTGLSCAFDLPTQMGYDSDHPRAEGEVGKVGVAIDSLDDMEMLFDGIPLDKVTTSMTINATGGRSCCCSTSWSPRSRASPGCDPGHHPERHPQGVHRPRHLHLPAPPVDAADHRHLRVLRRAPPELEHHLDLRLPHPRGRLDGGQEIAFTLANGIAYVEAAIDAGLDVDDFAPRLSFFWNAHNDFFEEVAKFRAARRMWARIMTERFGAKDANS